jgi:hypothetical protein
MRILFRIAALIAVALPCQAWRHPIPDYSGQFDSADVVAVIRVSRIAETGQTKRLRGNSRVMFRELEVQVEIVSLMKGKTNQPITCRLYRFPTIEEAKGDLGPRAHIELLAETPWESGLFVPRQWNHYLAYLKRDADGFYVPVRGFEGADYCFRELNCPSNDYPPGKAEPVGAANGSQPVRLETNSTPSAAGSRR